VISEGVNMPAKPYAECPKSVCGSSVARAVVRHRTDIIYSIK